MVKHTNFSTMAILLVAIIAIVLIAGVTSASQPSAPQPSPKEIISEAYYQTCKNKIGRHCGITIVSEMFFNNATTDASCCRNLLTMGKNCHVNMLGRILTVHPFSELKAFAMQRNRELMKRCSLLRK